MAPCRDVIDQQVPFEEREEMLVVTSIFAGIRYNDKRLLNKFLRSDHRVIESTTIEMLKEMFVAEKMKKMIRKKLVTRFGTVPDEVLSQIEVLEDENRLEELIEKSIICPSLAAFVECL